MDLRQYEGCRLAKPVFLIGFMGAGKTSVAWHLARALCLDAVDADDYLEQVEGRSIADVFAEDGQDYFRDKESACLEELARRSPCLVACGGGVVTRERNIQTMRAAGMVVYLEVTPEQVLERISDTSTRPLLSDIESARATMHARLPLYEKAADATVQTEGRTLTQVASEVAQALVDGGALVCP